MIFHRSSHPIEGLSHEMSSHRFLDSARQRPALDHFRTVRAS